MGLLLTIGNLIVGDVLIQLLFLSVPLTVIGLGIALIFVMKKKKSQLNRIEEKLDQVLLKREN